MLVVLSNTQSFYQTNDRIAYWRPDFEMAKNKTRPEAFSVILEKSKDAKLSFFYISGGLNES
jgi:hypothetical protein